MYDDRARGFVHQRQSPQHPHTPVFFGHEAYRASAIRKLAVGSHTLRPPVHVTVKWAKGQKLISSPSNLDTDEKYLGSLEFEAIRHDPIYGPLVAYWLRADDKERDRLEGDTCRERAMATLREGARADLPTKAVQYYLTQYAALGPGA
jgi:hypothetical protein